MSLIWQTLIVGVNLGSKSHSIVYAQSYLVILMNK